MAALPQCRKRALQKAQVFCQKKKKKKRRGGDSIHCFGSHMAFLPFSLMKLFPGDKLFKEFLSTPFSSAE
jgi:hypothetical protein